MCVDTGVTCRPRQIFVFSVWYVLLRACVAVLLGKAKVYDIHQIAFLSKTHEEIIRLDIAVDEVLCMNIFHSADLY